MIRLAIVGVGWAGNRQVEAIRELGTKLEVACLVDNDAEALAEQAAVHGVSTTYATLDEALADPMVSEATADLTELRVSDSSPLSASIVPSRRARLSSVPTTSPARIWPSSIMLATWTMPFNRPRQAFDTS